MEFKMRIPKLKYTRLEEKRRRNNYEDHGVFAGSSDVIVYNLYEQDWADIKREGLAHLFDSEAEFERRKAEYYDRRAAEEQESKK